MKCNPCVTSDTLDSNRLFVAKENLEPLAPAATDDSIEMVKIIGVLREALRCGFDKAIYMLRVQLHVMKR